MKMQEQYGSWIQWTYDPSTQKPWTRKDAPPWMEILVFEMLSGFMTAEDVNNSISNLKRYHS